MMGFWGGYLWGVATTILFFAGLIAIAMIAERWEARRNGWCIAADDATDNIGSVD